MYIIYREKERKKGEIIFTSYFCIWDEKLVLLLLLDSGKKGLTRRESGDGSRTVTKDRKGNKKTGASELREG